MLASARDSGSRIRNGCQPLLISCLLPQLPQLGISAENPIDECISAVNQFATWSLWVVGDPLVDLGCVCVGVTGSTLKAR